MIGFLMLMLNLQTANSPAQQCKPTREIWSTDCADHLKGVDFPREFFGTYARSERDCTSVPLTRAIVGPYFNIFMGRSLKAKRITRIDEGIFVEMEESGLPSVKYRIELKGKKLNVAQDGQKEILTYTRCW